MKPRSLIDHAKLFCLVVLPNQNCPLSLGTGRAVRNGTPALHGFSVAGSALATTLRDYYCFELV
jgi:hypothetical protein